MLCDRHLTMINHQKRLMSMHDGARIINAVSFKHIYRLELVHILTIFASFLLTFSE